MCQIFSPDPSRYPFCIRIFQSDLSLIQFSRYELPTTSGDQAGRSGRRRSSVMTSGDGEIRTHDPLLARQVLSQLSYTPKGLPHTILSLVWEMGLSGLEPPTSRLSGVRSNLLSYKPRFPGIHLLSHAVSSIVPSAARIFTVVFGMGTGVTSARIATRQKIFLNVLFSNSQIYGTLAEIQPLLLSLERR